jgi:hypothetical protein
MTYISHCHFTNSSKNFWIYAYYLTRSEKKKLKSESVYHSFAFPIESIERCIEIGFDLTTREQRKDDPQQQIEGRILAILSFKY